MAKICEVCDRRLGMLDGEKSVVLPEYGIRIEMICGECYNFIAEVVEFLKKDTFVVSDKLAIIGKIDGMIARAENGQSAAQLKKLREVCAAKYMAKGDAGQTKANTSPAPEAPPLVTVNQELYGEPLYAVHGNRGRHLFVYQDYVIIKTVTTFGSVITGNATDGEKVIFYEDCIGLQHKEPGMTIGYLQLETASGQMNNMKSGWFNENTFTYDSYTAEVRRAHKYIFERLKQIKINRNMNWRYPNE